ncbi:hypothetical protein YB2330_006666 [Saitoella coloradoensis]
MSQKTAGSNAKGTSSTGNLSISRNKHWKYISSYHGPWLQLPGELLQSLYTINVTTLPPAVLDPAIFADLALVRQLVDEATSLAVRAASATATAHVGRLSKERQHRMRELACQKLARAYAADEVAASVATMQASSALDDVAEKVLKRDPNHVDARYVHFFHEKIPSRKLADSTSLDVLDALAASSPMDLWYVRTRAIVRAFKDDYLGAIKDITSALATLKYLGGAGKNFAPVVPGGVSSLESQFVFHRASNYLSLAVRSIDAVPAGTPIDAEAQKAIRQYARRAIRDFTRFVGAFKFSPSVSVLVAAGDGPEPTSPPEEKPNVTYLLSELFAQDAKEPLEIIDLASLTAYAKAPPSTHTESGEIKKTPAVSYHPLLPDALFSLLLAHVLCGTQKKILYRHASWVARITSVCEGYPVFLPGRSTARADWIEVIKRVGVDLVEVKSWEEEVQRVQLPIPKVRGRPEPPRAPAPVPPSRGPGFGGEDTQQFPVVTERAGIVVRWVKEVGNTGIGPPTPKRRTGAKAAKGKALGLGDGSSAVGVAGATADSLSVKELLKALKEDGGDHEKGGRTA